MDKTFLVAVILIAVGFALVLFLVVPGVPVLPVLAVSLGVAVLFFLFWFFGDYLPLRRFVPLKQRFGFAAVPESPNILTGTWQEHGVRIQYQHASKRDRGEPRLKVQLLHNLGFLPGVVFRRESFFYRMVKAIGLSKEVQANDPLFDPKVYVESEDDEALAPLLAQEELRTQVVALLDLPWTVVTLDEEAVGILMRGHFGWSRYFKPDKVQEILDRLLAIEKSLKKASRTRFDPFKQPRETKVLEGLALTDRLALLSHPPRLAIFSASISAFLGPAMFFWGLWYQPVTWRLHLYALGLFVISFLVYVPLLFSFARGQSRSHQFFSTFLVAALVGFPTFWAGSLKVVNGFFDQQSPLAVEAHIVRRVSKGTRLEVLVQLYDESGTVSVAAPPQLYRSSRLGQSVPLLLSPGALGEPWVVGLPQAR